MIKHKTVIINWLGPFTYADIEDNPELGNGLYLVAGRLPYERQDIIQYCGITEGSYIKRFKNHHKIFEVSRNLTFWIGEVIVPENITRYYLEVAESLIIYFWQPALNERKKILEPEPTTIINYWCKKDGTPRFNQCSIYKELDDVLSWDGEYWRTGNLKVYENN